MGLGFCDVARQGRPMADAADGGRMVDRSTDVHFHGSSTAKLLNSIAVQTLPLFSEITTAGCIAIGCIQTRLPRPPRNSRLPQHPKQVI